MSLVRKRGIRAAPANQTYKLVNAHNTPINNRCVNSASAAVCAVCVSFICNYMQYMQLFRILKAVHFKFTHYDAPKAAEMRTVQDCGEASFTEQTEPNLRSNKCAYNKTKGSLCRDLSVGSA